MFFQIEIEIVNFPNWYKAMYDLWKLHEIEILTIYGIGCEFGKLAQS